MFYIENDTSSLTLTSIFGKNQRLEEERQKVQELNELWKTVNYITIQNHRKNKTNVLKRYQANELCMNALHQTANYQFSQTEHKINLTR